MIRYNNVPESSDNILSFHTLCLFNNRNDHRAWFECVEDPQYNIKVGAKKANGQCCDQAELRKIIGNADTHLAGMLLSKLT